MNKTKIAFGIGIVLVVITVLTAPALAQDPNNVFYLVPEDSSCEGAECTTTVWVMLNTANDTVNAFQASLIFDPSVVNVTLVEEGTNPDWYMWDWQVYDHEDMKYVFIGASDLLNTFGPGELELGKVTLQGEAAGASALHFGCQAERGSHMTQVSGTGGYFCGPHLEGFEECTMNDGTFTCVGAEETFNKPLVAGWNLISLPLTATDMTVSNVMASLTYDELYKYDASTNSYAPVDPSDTMANGVGYFISMTTEDTWTYSGTAYGVMNEGYSDGLNMIGWLNCTKDISTTSLDDPSKTYYISRWDATKQEYETYNPVAPGDFNDFTEMVRGEGYFVSMKTDGTLSESC